MKYQPGEIVRVLRIPGVALVGTGHTAMVTRVDHNGNVLASMMRDHSTSRGHYPAGETWAFYPSDLRRTVDYTKQRVDAGPTWGVPTPGGKHG